MKTSRTLILTLSFALLLAGAASQSGCSSDEPTTDQAFTPFSVTVTVQNATVADVTHALAAYLQDVDDTDSGMPADWIVAGADALEAGQPAEDAALSLPGGAKLVEVCNHHYAEQAMSFGGHHGVALPCEIAIHQVGDDVEVVLLNPEAIFALFFHDIPAEHAASLGGLAATVRGELEDVITLALADFELEVDLEDLGPAYTSADLADLSGLRRSIVMDREIPAAYLGSTEDRETYRDLFLTELLETLTHEGMETVGSQVTGLSVGDWRAAREKPLGLPGGVKVVEMCSPTYASAAIGTGAYHAPALPCQAAVWVEGDVLRIHLLDPQFIFPVFFGDAPAEMMSEMEGLVAAVRADLQLIVNAVQVETE